MAYKITNSTGLPIDFPVGDEGKLLRVPAGESQHDDVPASVLDAIQRNLAPSGVVRVEKVGAPAPAPAPAPPEPQPQPIAPASQGNPGTGAPAQPALGAPAPVQPLAPSQGTTPRGAGFEHVDHDMHGRVPRSK